MFSENFVSTGPFGGVGGDIGRAQDLVRDLIQVHLLLVGPSEPWGARLTASRVRPPSRQNFP